ncbi:MAG: hypothetical protein [Bacteriophage sp.]|nr:MAG: hypothetical protein [Bacteriophage sp.]
MSKQEKTEFDYIYNFKKSTDVIFSILVINAMLVKDLYKNNKIQLFLETTLPEDNKTGTYMQPYYGCVYNNTEGKRIFNEIINNDDELNLIYIYNKNKDEFFPYSKLSPNQKAIIKKQLEMDDKLSKRFLGL